MIDDVEFANAGSSEKKFLKRSSESPVVREYGSKETILSSCLKALGVSSNFNATGKILHLIEAELAKKDSISCGLTMKQLNEYLDRLAVAQNRETQISVFLSLIAQTNADEMMFIISIILKDILPLNEFEALHLVKNHQYLTLEAARLISLLRKREKNLHLSGRWLVDSTIRSATSVQVKLQLHKMFRTFNQAEVGKIYMIYDKPTTSVDVWITRREPNSNKQRLPYWTNLNTQRMASLNSRTFLNDEGGLISMVLGRGLETCFFSGPPPLILINAFFFPREVDNEYLPHLVSITTSNLISSWEVSARTLEQKFCTKVIQGCLSVCTKLPSMRPLDRSLISCKGMKLPKFIAERIGGGNIDKSATDFFLSLVGKLSQCHTPEGVSNTKKTFAEVLSKSFHARQIVDVLIQCTHYIEETQIQDFVEEVCSTLSRRIVATGSASNPENYLLDLLFPKD